MLRENFIMEQGYCNRYMEKAMVQKITIAFPCSGLYLLKRIFRRWGKMLHLRHAAQMTAIFLEMFFSRFVGK